MEIGRNPNVAPGAVGEVKSNNNSNQATQLPEFKTVTPAERADSPQLTFREVPLDNQPGNISGEPRDNTSSEIRERTDTSQMLRREIEIDRERTALIFRSIDTSTGEVVRQYPEEARLNLRAYIDEQLSENIK